MKYPFIVIDDSPIDCLIVKKVIGFSGKSSDVKVFNDATLALQYIESNEESLSASISFITLDIMMPIMNGFEFLDKFIDLPKSIQERYKIIILSLSNNEHTIKRLQKYKVIEAIVEKPITMDKFAAVIGKFQE
ncbi:MULTISPECIES: response regulator [Olivibacter]|jgi:CheY-like chemotaxis protein|uniref:Response regulator receiver n=2 Tax=Sphingobacteriaceae TaxID=84566 RepID=F4CB35_SPHS2|nr:MULTISPECIES: response regulator [Olivibacter]MDM8176768.1 response regulator [Olivibacter sp. 47]QEL00583.1 response regulator [Olivibacter sp. LS-1]